MIILTGIIMLLHSVIMSALFGIIVVKSFHLYAPIIISLICIYTIYRSIQTCVLFCILLALD